MPKIRVLPESLINIIAAGEVIERPASVVKELVENAIDAGGADLRIEVLKGGKRLIRVSDDGVGMDREDALRCLTRHATSKLSDATDLFRIATMGFRGEALSSIAAVSKIRLTTTPRGDTAGTLIEVAGGERRFVRDATGAGTVIEVRDLFFNTPVRKKFLKTDTTELYHIIDGVTRAALVHSHVRIHLAADGREVLSLPPAAGLKERILQVYGRDFLNGLLTVSVAGGDAGIALNGFLSASGNVRKTRSAQFLFINGRPVMDASLRHAVYQGYEGSLGRNDHPMFMLHVQIDPAKVDVNVHPQKKEVRLLDREAVYQAVLTSVREALREEGGEKAGPGGGGAAAEAEWSAPGSADIEAVHRSRRESAIDSQDFVAETGSLAYTVDTPFVYLGDVFAAYPCRGGLCVIDHHAAHERILYEKLKKGSGIVSHRLLFPRQVRLGPRECSLLLAQKDVLAKMGMEIEDFGGHTIVVRTVPEGLDEAALDAVLPDVATSITDLGATSPIDERTDSLAKGLACHRAVRGAGLLGREEFTRLLQDLDAAGDPDHCPHGRPTRVYFSLQDLRKLFGRI